MEVTQKKFDELIERVGKMQKSGEVDLSRDEDLSVAVMNLLSLEEHFFFSGAKTGKSDYYNLLNEVREARKALMKKLLPQTEAETWCISKHLLATTMRLIEVGTKLKSDKNDAEAADIFKQAYKMYSMFWALRLKIINVSELKKTPAAEKPWTVEDIVNKLVDCCGE